MCNVYTVGVKNQVVLKNKIIVKIYTYINAKNIIYRYHVYLLDAIAYAVSPVRIAVTVLTRRMWIRMLNRWSIWWGEVSDHLL